MKQQTRPFIVEVKQKRGIQKRGNSIWGDIDLSAAMAETTMGAEAMDPPNRHDVDPNLRPVDAEGENNPQAEYHMADPQEAESPQITAEAPAKPKAPGPKKKAPRRRKVQAEPKQPARRNGAKAAPAAAEAPATAVRTGRKIYSSKERAQKLGQIEKSIGSGETLKSAAMKVGISEQTFYQWKKVATPASDGGDLKDLLALEEENKRLKGLLAEHLRKENAELKTKLGLA
ncbi:transposase [Mesorhizobium sp. 43Arga]